jgi:hypothetical protein
MKCVLPRRWRRSLLVGVIAALGWLDCPSSAQAVTFGGNSYAGVTITQNLQMQTVSTGIPGASWNAGQGGLQTNVPYSSVGAGANQFSEIYCAVRTLSASSNETLNLYGSLTDPFGNTISFARVKSITFELLTTSTGASANASSITWEGGVSDPWVGPLGGTTPTVNVLSGGYSAFATPGATGWVVTSGSVENIKVVNNDSGNAATYRITVIGSTT